MGVTQKGWQEGDLDGAVQFSVLIAVAVVTRIYMYDEVPIFRFRFEL